MTAEAWILDGYVDEPACLGVPPYISPYIRTIAGVFRDHDFSVRYVTIDEVRSDPRLIPAMNQAAWVVMIAGVTVPGKYLGGTPADQREIRQIGDALTGPVTGLGGPVQFGFSGQGGRPAEYLRESGFDHLLTGSPAAALDSVLLGGDPSGDFSYSRENGWAVSGASVIRDHPRFPQVICELETARGCARSVSGGCSFCTEPLYGEPVHRDQVSVRDEVFALYTAGARHFRLGRQPDLLAYRAGGGEYPRPDPEALRELFTLVRTAAPDLKTLHIDNINPGTIACHPEAAAEALVVIVEGHTPGDVAAFGMETADPAVIAASNLKASPEMVMDAIRIVNEVGAGRRAGVPDLLPGLNFIGGLAGETKETYRLNREFLTDVLASGYLVRRINIRQLMPFQGTRAWDENTLPVSREFASFKEWARKTIDLPMLRKVFPVGTVLRDVVVEQTGDLSFGRQLGSYPILAGIPVPLPVGMVTDIVIVDHGMRSVTGLPYPVPVNLLPAKSVKWIPGLSKKGAVQVLAKRPFTDMKTFLRISGTSLPADAFSLSLTSPEVPSP